MTDLSVRTEVSRITQMTRGGWKAPQLFQDRRSQGLPVLRSLSLHANLHASFERVPGSVLVLKPVPLSTPLWLSEIALLVGVEQQQ